MQSRRGFLLKHHPVSSCIKTAYPPFLNAIPKQGDTPDIAVLPRRISDCAVRHQNRWLAWMGVSDLPCSIEYLVVANVGGDLAYRQGWRFSLVGMPSETCHSPFSPPLRWRYLLHPILMNASNLKEDSKRYNQLLLNKAYLFWTTDGSALIIASLFWL